MSAGTNLLVVYKAVGVPVFSHCQSVSRLILALASLPNKLTALILRHIVFQPSKMVN